MVGYDDTAEIPYFKIKVRKWGLRFRLLWLFPGDSVLETDLFLTLTYILCERERRIPGESRQVTKIAFAFFVASTACEALSFLTRIDCVCVIPISFIWNQWGEDGYFRVAQTEKGRFGLFGILAEGVIVNAQNVTAEVPDEEQNVPLPVWAIVLIVLASICCCLVLFQMLTRTRAKMGSE